MLWQILLGQLWLDDIDLVIFLDDLSSSYFVTWFINSRKVLSIILPLTLLIWILQLSVELVLLVNQIKLLLVAKPFQHLDRLLSHKQTIFCNHFVRTIIWNFIWTLNWQVAFHVFNLSEAERLQVYLRVIVIVTRFFCSVRFSIFEIGLGIFGHSQLSLMAGIDDWSVNSVTLFKYEVIACLCCWEVFLELGLKLWGWHCLALLILIKILSLLGKLRNGG